MEKIGQILASPESRPYLEALIFVDLVIRGFALYKSARREQKIWFILLLMFNTLGLLPAIYLFSSLRGAKSSLPVTLDKPTPKVKKKIKK